MLDSDVPGKTLGGGGGESINCILLHGVPRIRSLIPCGYFYKNYF